MIARFLCVRTDLHPTDRVFLPHGLIQETAVLEVLCHTLQEGERLVEDHRHRDFRKLLTNALLQNGPEGEVGLRELRGWKTCSVETSKFV